MDIVLVANSPGELSALVKPMAEEFSQNKANRVILLLTPCQYISGKELDFSRTLKGLSAIISAAEYKKWIFFQQTPQQLKFAEQGFVLYLGGDLAHAVLVAKRLKYPAFAYVNERISWKKAYRQFFVPDQETFDKFAKSTPKNKLKVVGNLMVDSIAELDKWAPDDKVLTFMPGSRQWEIDYMTPFYSKIIDIIRHDMPNLKFQLVNSPFVKANKIEGITTIDFKAIENSGLVVTIPGTNTAKVAARGIPMVVVFPLNNPEVIPLEGVADIFGKLPVMGKAFKTMLAKIINRQTKYFALPNQKANLEIVPEIRGKIEPLDVALQVMTLIKDRNKRVEMSHQLIKAMGKPGAAKALAGEIYASL